MKNYKSNIILAFVAAIFLVLSCTELLPGGYAQFIQSATGLTGSVKKAAYLGKTIHPSMSMGLGGAYAAGTGTLWYVTSTAVFAIAVPSMSVQQSHTFSTEIPYQLFAPADPQSGKYSQVDIIQWHVVKELGTGNYTLWGTIGISSGGYRLITIPINNMQPGDPTVTALTGVAINSQVLSLGYDSGGNKREIQFNGTSIEYHINGVNQSNPIPLELRDGYLVDFSTISENIFLTPNSDPLNGGAPMLTADSQEGKFHLKYYELSMSQAGQVASAAPKTLNVDFSPLVSLADSSNPFTLPQAGRIFQSADYVVVTDGATGGSGVGRFAVIKRSDNTQVKLLTSDFFTSSFATENGLVVVTDVAWTRATYISNYEISDHDAAFYYLPWGVQ